MSLAAEKKYRISDNELRLMSNLKEKLKIQVETKLLELFALLLSYIIII